MRKLTGEKLEAELARLEGMRAYEHQYESAGIVCGIDEAGRCSNFRLVSIMTAARKNKSFGISMLINTQCFIAGCSFCDYLCSL